MKILYLCNKDYYMYKTSRVRFHSVKAVSELPQVQLKFTGVNWEGFNLQNEIEIFKPDLIWTYMPLQIKGIDNIKIPKCITYNEMWNGNLTKNELIKSKMNIVICHHRNEYEYYKKTSLSKMMKFFNLPHSAEKTFFKDYKFKKEYDLLLIGALSKYYPLRERLVSIITKMKNNFVCKVYPHPSGKTPDAYTNKYIIDFAMEINAAKICLTCSSKYKLRLGKYVEVPMCHSALAADMPNDDETMKDFLIEISNDMSDKEIIDILTYYLENDKALKEKTDKGILYISKYTQQDYAERFYNIVEQCI